MSSKFRSGFVAIMGRPNVGKSSLMNRFVGEKVAIVSNHPQTTRTQAAGRGYRRGLADRVRGHARPAQAAHQAGRVHDEEPPATPREGVDAVLAVVDGQRIGEGDRADAGRRWRRMQCPKFLAVNKIDLVSPGKADAPAGKS